MGYTHYWHRVEGPDGPLPPEPAGAYGRLALETLSIIAAADVALADGLATPGSRPAIDEGAIWFNGAPPHDAETFVWPAQPGGEPWWTTRVGERWIDFCKTSRQPYDLVVCAVLIRAGTHYGPSVLIASDGTWDGPDWYAARRLVVDLYGLDADRDPLVQL